MYDHDARTPQHDHRTSERDIRGTEPGTRRPEPAHCRSEPATRTSPRCIPTPIAVPIAALRLAPILVAFVLAFSPLSGQLIPIRTVPVASGDQFLTVPSATLGMAGTTIAVDDSIADLWSNPAKGVFVNEPVLMGAPTFYGVSDQGGGGKTFPFTGLLRAGEWFGGASVALQQLSGREEPRFWIEPWPVPTVGRLSERSARNLYGRVAIGRRIADSGWSVGIAAHRAGLNMMGGVDQLYAGADRIDQRGAVTDLRAGVFRDGERDRVGLTLIHNRVSMEHEVHYTDVVFPDTVSFEPTIEFREELNEDRTRTWGGHFEWDRRLGEDGWRIGATLTANHKWHPKIPNYEIQNIPRDPGTTWAYEAGFGVGRHLKSTSFGIDIAYQPIWSHTWQEADRRMETPGGVLEVGDMTIENHFRFSNVVLRSGISQRYDRFGFQLGLEARSYAYHLEQDDHVEATSRDQDEAWTEWTPSFGVRFRTGGFELHSSTRVTSGTGFPGIDGFLAPDARQAAAPASPDFIAAPRGALTLQDVTVLTHQIWIRVPIR